MATGSLPPVAKNVLLNGVNRTNSAGNLVLGSDKGSDSTVLASCDTTDSCRVEDVKDKPDIVIVDHDVTAAYHQSESLHTEFTNCRTVPSEAETAHSNIESEFERRGVCEAVDQYRIIGASSMQFDTSSYGTLYYEPPVLDSYDQLDSILGNTILKQSGADISPTVSSPTPFITPPSVNSRNLSARTPESILKIAAKSFPNTPSILRKRKFVQQPKETVLASSEHDHINSSENTGLRNNSLCANLTCGDDDDDDGLSSKSFNASPPYRIRFKRTSVLKSVEKQLNFAAVMEQDFHDSNPKAGDLKVKKGPPATKFVYKRQRRG